MSYTACLESSLSVSGETVQTWERFSGTPASAPPAGTRSAAGHLGGCRGRRMSLGVNQGAVCSGIPTTVLFAVCRCS